MPHKNPEVVVVGEAANGQQGLELATKLKPDVVIIDLDMPVMDGATAIPLIRAAVPTARLCAFSATRAADPAGAAARLGADYFWDKTAAVGDIAERVLAAVRPGPESDP